MNEPQKFDFKTRRKTAHPPLKLRNALIAHPESNVFSIRNMKPVETGLKKQVEMAILHQEAKKHLIKKKIKKMLASEGLLIQD